MWARLGLARVAAAGLRVNLLGHRPKGKAGLLSEPESKRILPLPPSPYSPRVSVYFVLRPFADHGLVRFIYPFAIGYRVSARAWRGWRVVLPPVTPVVHPLTLANDRRHKTRSRDSDGQMHDRWQQLSASWCAPGPHIVQAAAL